MDVKEIVHAFRGIVSRAVVRSTNDGGETQTASVTTHRHVDRTDVEIAQPFGLASRAPSGGLMIVFAIGGDQGDLAGLPVAAPGSRLGNLAEGETAIYNTKGDRVHLKADGTIEVLSANKVVVKVKEATVTVEEDRIVAKLGSGTGAPRHVVRPDHVKMRRGDHWVVVQESGVVVSAAPVVGPDPEPAV